jgi:hypothetical protein
MFLFLPTWIWLLFMAGLIGFVGLYAWWHRRPGSLMVTGRRRLRVLFAVMYGSGALSIALIALASSHRYLDLQDFISDAVLLLACVFLVSDLLFLNELLQGLLWWGMTWWWRDRAESIMHGVARWVRLRR